MQNIYPCTQLHVSKTYLFNIATQYTKIDFFLDIQYCTCVRMFVLVEPARGPPVLLLLVLEGFPGVPLLVLQALLAASSLVQVTLLQSP